MHVSLCELYNIVVFMIFFSEIYSDDTSCVKYWFVANASVRVIVVIIFDRHLSCNVIPLFFVTRAAA